MILYLNLNPGCLSLYGLDTDFRMKVAELFATLLKVLEVTTETRLLGSAAGFYVLLKQKAEIKLGSAMRYYG